MTSVHRVLAIGLFALANCGGGADGTAGAPPTAPTPAPSQSPPPPGRPTGIRVVDVGVNFLVWTWDPVETATSYQAHAFPAGTPPSERPPLRVTLEPTFRADGLEPDSAMTIFVRAIREQGLSRVVGPWSAPGTGKTLAPPPPGPPMSVTGTVRASGGPVSVVAGAVVRARNLDTGTVDGEATTDMDGAYAIEGLRGDRYSVEVRPPSGYLSASPALVSRPESGELELKADLLLRYYTVPDGAATALPAGRLIYKPANIFDLEGKTVTFTPSGDGYAVEVADLNWEQPRPTSSTRRLDGTRHQFVEVDLPFRFPFADRTWDRVYANANGHVSFQRPESENWWERDPWADGTMRSLAATIDSRSAAGLEAQIAALWAIYGDVRLSVNAAPSRVVFTWSANRPEPGYKFNAPLGPNVFQARLYASGRIELAYRAVAERDGFVGLFRTLTGRGPILDAPAERAGDVEEPAVDITGLELVDAGSTLLFRMTLAEDVPEAVDDGEIDYRIFPSFGEYDCRLGLEVNAAGQEPFLRDCGPAPGKLGHRIRGSTVELFVSKTLLHGADLVEWDADALWRGREQADRAFDSIQEVGTARIDRTDLDLGALAGTVNGNVFEVFHYPVFPKIWSNVTSYIYEHVPANDEIAVLFTDFRIDDLFGHGPSTGAVNVPVEGIEEWGANARAGHEFGSESLLVTMAPQFIGAENLWRKTGMADNGHPFRNFAEGVWWIAHEATHRWVAFMNFRNPLSGKIESLRTDDPVHWSDFLHAPAMYPVWPGFSRRGYAETSVNSGGVWKDNGNGTFTRQDDGTALARGLSALDLYAMGMIPPEDVPDTFILRVPEGTRPWGTVRATKVPVRIDDVIAAMGPRVPAADESRREFRLGVYLLHDGIAPRPALLRKARDISAAVADYFFRATDGRMLVLANPGSTQ